MYYNHHSEINIVLTGASRRPVKNFLILRAILTCSGVTGGRRTHGLPGSLQTK